MSITIPIQIETTGSDILETALYGGIGYWARVTEVVRDNADNGEGILSIKLFEHEDGEVTEQDDPTIITVTAEQVERATETIMQPAPEGTYSWKDAGAYHVGEVIRGYVAKDDIDADAADAIVQIAALGKVVYG